MKLLTYVLLGATGASRMGNTERLIVYVGARTTKARNARGDGINVYELSDDLTWKHIQLFETDNPSFLCVDRTGRFLYIVHGDSDRVSAFSIDDSTGQLAFLNTQSTDGRNPVHLSIDPTNRILVVANHVTSSLAALPRLEDGTLGKITNLSLVTGEIGPHRVEQPFPKPHQVEFDPSGNWIAVPDKGTDSVLVYSVNSDTGTLLKNSACDARETSGPRHIAFHPGGRHAYVINELDSTVTACRFDPDAGKLEPFQILSCLPETFVGNSRGAEIRITADGHCLYASNRGSDTIAAFRLDATGYMRLVGHWRTGGKTPRFFTILPNGVLLVANEDSDNITAFDIEQKTGALRARPEILLVGSPVCILVTQLD